ncbi:hypothetical protein MKW98_010762 [Papaver atlanticum]|uniref:Phytocyanin domain-containing protein n=1 Tax=Papaver atlanticum TaxID=357466 RepID=A0AAD4SM07_9MAGN|nr:hypothetical protein MKW98_010762 [Papaver atlanticum]
MESLMRRLAITTVVTVSLLMIHCDALKHDVGGTKYSGWAPNKMNYTSDWASHEQFYVGDWLYWGFDEPRINRQLYSVFEVNKTDYESCSTDHPLYNISKGGGRDVYQLNHARPYYFISGGGFCWQGMKLTLVVQELPPAPTEAPSSSGSTYLSASLPGIFAIAAATALRAVL